MKVTVVHTAFEDAPRIVAEVEAPHAKVEEALEYAYRWTNNVMGSWSIKREMISEDYANGDLNDAVTVKAPLHVDDKGNEWGHRSTSVGDMMHVDGRSFEVARMGFQELI
tara:strand:- start:993 stop:1322 length:330 start_codon:yes stop_codon:yes gene_type:complete